MAVDSNSGRAWVQSLSRFGIRPGLERTERVLEALGNPHRGLRFYHVAGTNGKGSVCAFLSEILGALQRTGVFTSPSFDGYRGRMRVDGSNIRPEDFERLACRVRDAALTVTPEDMVTEFEALTCIACMYFAEQQVDAVVWETGLGGRYDSTNVVHPVVAAITNVGLDHTEILGPTVRHIARDKSGIIKSGADAVTAAEGEALQVIQAAALAAGTTCHVYGVHFQVVRRVTNASVVVDYRGLEHDWYALPCTLFGAHQAKNLAVALAMYECGLRAGVAVPLTDVQLRAALRKVAWPGRFEIGSFRGRPMVLDGAHNPDGAHSLVAALAEFGRLRRLDGVLWTLVVGILGDKDVDTILRTVLPVARRVVVTAPDNGRALPVGELAQRIRAIDPTLPVMEQPRIVEALACASAFDDPICCMGSLYTVHEAREAMDVGG
ncbi:MAG: bifunctional folylpolyglutamate synthase/dihydrofolate synthase [Alicyclobacillus sp.]|nr:bifunctional folylpolyglutamate synthase/dihydrofolate synthase [Alicyclobacillus sp.]